MLKANMPPMMPSDEATKEQLKFAKEQGSAVEKAINHLLQTQGAERHVGDYMIGYAVEKAEGMYSLQGDELVWNDPKEENAHIEILVRDASDGRFIPGLKVWVSVFDENDNEIGTHIQPFIWHPWLFHYGRNWTLPGDGVYTIHISIDAPTFMRHDKQNGRRYTEPVHIEFKNVQIETGQKLNE